ncbi:MAG TPA: sulfotransferase [Caulobacteraceae bacterium]|jgi:tetratricopeptide (TPR) repeat protein|nr:sulfotransferase [Caulobacteraceae bacterium]
MTEDFAQRPDGIDPRLIAVEAAITSGDLGRALELAEAALSEGLLHPMLLNLRALYAEDQGRFEDSLADLKRAHALAPSDVSILNAMGLCHMSLGQSEEAVVAFDQATTAGPGFAQAWNNKGVAQQAHGDLNGGRQSFETAARLQPGFAEPLGHLALMAARRGDREAARSAAGAALSLKPNLSEAVRAMAEVELAEGDLAGAERRLSALLIDPTLGPNGRYLSRGLLGDVLDRQGRYREAFEAYQGANQGQRQAHADRFGRRLLTETVDDIHRAFQAAWPAREPPRARPSSASPARRHIFLIGFMRSGTTLMEQVLASQPDAVSLEEKEALVTGTTTYLNRPAEGMARLRDADDRGLEPHRADYWDRVRRFGVDPDGKVFVDKMPFNGMKLPLIHRLFPEARIIFAVRDPRDVVFSCFRQRFAVTTHTYPLLTLPTAVRFYDAYMRSVMTYNRVLRPMMRTYRHEDLVEDFNGVVQALCAFLDLPWNEAMRDIGRRSRAGRVASPSAPQLLGGLSRTGLGQWRRYERDLAPYYGALQPWLRQFGYE